MKLWKKISILTTGILLLALGFCGGFTIIRMGGYSIEQRVLNEGKQMEGVGYAFEQFCKSNDLLDMSDTVKASFLDFQFKKCCGRDYALIQKGVPVINLTEYQVSDTGILDRLGNWDGEHPEYEIQKLNDRYILLMARPVEGMEASYILTAKDITQVFTGMKKQAVMFGGVYLLVSLLAAAGIGVMIRFTLRPLQNLEKASLAISEGQYTERVPATTGDEIQVVGEAFNQMADQVESQITQLQEITEKQKMLLGSLTHELKTPMTSIMGYADTLLHVKLQEEQKEKAVSYIYQECCRLERLSGKMMSLTGLYVNDTVHLKLSSVEELFQKVAHVEERHFREKGIQFSMDCRMEKIPMDSDLMESLLVNLVDNAIKASRPGGCIWMEAKEHKIEVIDEGRGIPPHEISKVTEAFYRVDKARTKKEGGIGLGLALCKEIAHVHKASLEIESSPGCGTVARIVFTDAYNLFTTS
jgi:signal transduction histidine kinase